MISLNIHVNINNTFSMEAITINARTAKKDHVKNKIIPATSEALDRSIRITTAMNIMNNVLCPS